MTPSLASMDRRSFLRSTALAGGGLVLGFSLTGTTAAGADVVNAGTLHQEGAFFPNGYVKIAPDGTITLLAHKVEIGQGIKTSLPMVVAEELDVAWDQVQVVDAPLDPQYGWQGAGGSTSTPSSYTTLRRAGATARALLITAAAQTWGVPAAECTTSAGTVVHRASGRSLPYGELASKAAALPVPKSEDVPLKDPKDFKLLGKRITGVDNPKIVTGKPLFGIDQKVPGMLYAVYVKCPVFGGKPIKANVAHLKRLPNVKDAFIVEGTQDLYGLMPGVAIVADSTWAAYSARRQLQVSWEEGPAADESWTGFMEKAVELSKGPGKTVLRKDGDASAALAAAPRVVEAEYVYPFASHANLEPQNCTASVTAGGVEIWAPTQNASEAVNLVAKVLDLPKEKVTLHVTRIGGGFGRRLFNDYVAEAAMVSKRVGAPVQVVWNREDDLQHDMYRPGGYYRFRGAVDADGKVAAWHCHFVTPGNNAEQPGNGASLHPDEFPAKLVPNFLSEQTVFACNVPMGWWRAPGSCTVAFAMQGFLDELAVAAGRDPLQFRVDLLASGAEPAPAGERGAPFSPKRARGVLEEVARKAEWGKKLPKGKGQGVAFHYSHRGYVAQVAEVTVSPDGTLKVDRVVSVADVGSQIINLSGAENQVEGSIVDGLSAAWLQEMTYESGRMMQTNFHDYLLLRIADAPRIECHFLKTDNPPTGLGEPALPPLAPAVCNAIFAATGKRVRQMPFSKSDLSWS